jgi:hypothetical protein
VLNVHVCVCVSMFYFSLVSLFATCTKKASQVYISQSVWILCMYACIYIYTYIMLHWQQLFHDVRRKACDICATVVTIWWCKVLWKNVSKSLWDMCNSSYNLMMQNALESVSVYNPPMYRCTYMDLEGRVCMWVVLKTHTHMHLCLLVYVCMYACKSRACMHAIRMFMFKKHTRVFVCACVYMCMYVMYVCICMRACVYKYKKM